jgi:hypothetical protein
MDNKLTVEVVGISRDGVLPIWPRWSILSNCQRGRVSAQLIQHLLLRPKGICQGCGLVNTIRISPSPSVQSSIDTGELRSKHVLHAQQRE